MKTDYRVIIVLAVNAVLYVFISQVNALLAPLALHLSIPVVYLVFSALYLRMSHACAVAVLSGLTIDAALPVAFGCHSFLFVLAYALIISIRLRLRRENAYHVTFLSLGANFFIIAGLTLVTGFQGAPMGPSLLRLLIDLIFSQLVLAVVAASVVAAQRRILQIFQIDIASELQTL